MPAGSVLFRNGRKRRMNMTKEELKQLPKIELHCHLDGSLSREFIEKRLGRQVSQEELTVSDDCTSLAEYLEKFDIPGRCLMDEQGLAEYIRRKRSVSSSFSSSARSLSLSVST